MADGYCLAYRKSWSHPVFKDLREAAIWNFLYQNAFWQDGIRQFNGHTFELKRGQIVVSVSFLAKGFGMTDKGVRVVIQKLEKQGMLGKQRASKGTIITICNYNKYQSNEKTEGEQEGDVRAIKGQSKGNNKKQPNKHNEPKEGKKAVLIEVPSFISGEVWESWIQHRSEIKKKLTATQSQAQIKKLTAWNENGLDANEIILNSIGNGWTGLFKPKTNNVTTKRNSVDDELQQFLDR